MGYLNDLYLKPFKKLAKNWKNLLFSVIAEGIAILVIYFILTSALSYIEKTAEPLENQDLTNSTKVINMVDPYKDEVQTFVSTIYIIGFFAFLFSFLIYTCSRYLIWQLLLKKRLNLVKTLLVDFILLIILLTIFVICILLIKPESYYWFLLFTFVPLLFYSFFCHMYLDKKLKEIFSSVINIKLLYIIPHFIVAVLVASLFLNNQYTIIFSIVILSILRILSIEIIRK